MGDAAVFVENKSSIDKIPAHLMPLIKQAQGIYESVFGEKLLSFYLKGSAGRGDYIEGVSDIDFAGIIDGELNDECKTKLEEGRVSLTQTDKIDRLDFAVYNNNKLLASPRSQFLFATDGVHLGGKEFVPTVTFPPIGLELAQLLDNRIPEGIDKVRAVHKTRYAGEDYDLPIDSRWVAKQALRLALGVAMTKQPVYSQKIDEIVSLSLAVLPELRAPIELLASARLNPPKTIEELEAIFAAASEIEKAAKEVGVARE